MTSGGASTILWVIDEGATVKKGDVLCPLDSSEYEELVRTSRRSRPSRPRPPSKQAKLNLEVAELAVREYRDGLTKQTSRRSKADRPGRVRPRARQDRLRWTEKMLGKGYVPGRQSPPPSGPEGQAEQDLLTTQSELRNFRESRHPRRP